MGNWKRCTARTCERTYRRCSPPRKRRQSASHDVRGSHMVPDVALVDRFRADLDTLIDPGTRFGIAVSGGPDSLALLMLAESSRPGEFEAATVDHGLRPESAAEAKMVADLCEEMDVPHAILAIEWDLPPASAIQEQARAVRY